MGGVESKQAFRGTVLQLTGRTVVSQRVEIVQEKNYCLTAFHQTT